MSEQAVFIYKTVVHHEQNVHNSLLHFIFLGFEKDFTIVSSSFTVSIFAPLLVCKKTPLTREYFCISWLIIVDLVKQNDLHRVFYFQFELIRCCCV